MHLIYFIIKVLISGFKVKEKITSILQQTQPELSTRIDITVRSMGGARIENIVEKMDSRHSGQKYFDIIFAFVGVNNLTRKKDKFRVIHVYETLPELVEVLTDKFTELKLSLADRANKIIISQIVGIDIDTYNKGYHRGRWFYYQHKIDTAMPIIAHTINLINRDDMVIGPWITGTIHDYVNHKLYTQYAKLYDGLHPRENLKTIWAKRFAEAIVKNVLSQQLPQ